MKPRRFQLEHLTLHGEHAAAELSSQTVKHSPA